MQIRNFLVKSLITFLLLTMPLLSVSAKTYARLYIFHINGINTSKEDAYNNRYELEKAAKVGYQLTSWNILYNETHGLLKSDIFDVLRQKNQEHEELDVYDFVDAYMEAHNLNYPFKSPEYRNLLTHLKELYAKDLDFVGRNFDDLLKQYHKIVETSAKAIIAYLNAAEPNKHHMALFVPHSQGSLYANSIIDYLINAEDFPPQLIGLYAFASPASKLAYSTGDEGTPVIGNHLTADNDFVINSLRTFSYMLPESDSPLSTNIHLNICHDKNMCHGLVTAYLANSEAIRQFCVDVNRIVGRLISRSMLA